MQPPILIKTDFNLQILSQVYLYQPHLQTIIEFESYFILHFCLLFLYSEYHYILFTDWIYHFLVSWIHLQRHSLDYPKINFLIDSIVCHLYQRYSIFILFSVFYNIWMFWRLEANDIIIYALLHFNLNSNIHHWKYWVL